MVQPSLLDRIEGNFGLEYSPGYLFVDALMYFTSPDFFNPLNHNPVKTVLEEIVDFERLRQKPAVKLFLCATNVRTGKAKVFRAGEISVDRVLASTCLPLLMQPVEIDGEVYWDGELSGNPVVYPLVYECEARDVVMVHLTPAERPEIPSGSHAIINRMQEISFNSGLIREMRAVTFVNKRIDEGKMDGGKVMLIHVIEAEDVIREFPGFQPIEQQLGFFMPSV